MYVALVLGWKPHLAGLRMQAALAWAILTSWGWRWLVALSSLPLLALMLLYPCLPESPYWLLATGQTAAAEALLARIAAANSKALPRGRLRPGAAAAAAKVPFLYFLVHAENKEHEGSVLMHTRQQ